MRYAKFFNLILSLFLFAGLLTGGTLAQSNSSTKNEHDGNRKYIKLQIYGMSCPFCGYGLEKKLTSLKGVENFYVDIKSGFATLNVPASTKVSKDELKKLVSNAGFELKSVEYSNKPFRKKRNKKK